MSIDWIPTGSTRKITAKEIGNRGFFPSNKVKGGITEYESCLERDFLLECNHAPSVKRFQHQPITIKYKDSKGKNRKYTPDVYVEYTNGMKGLYEIKYEEEVINKGKNYEERWSEAEKWASARGIVFSVLTEKQIRTPRWFNIWFTLGSSKCSSNNNYTSKLNTLIPDEGESYNQLCFRQSEELGIEINKSAQILCYAIYHGLVFVDSFSTKQISKDTIIRKRKQRNKSPFRPLYEELGISTTSDIMNINAIKETNELLENENLLKTISYSIPSKYEEIVSKKENVVKLWLRKPSKGRTSEWREEFCKNWKVSEKTVYNWVGAYQKEGIQGLIPNHNRAGRPTKFANSTLELMEKARKHFLKPLMTLKKAYRKLKYLCNQQNISIPSNSSFEYYIYKNTTASELARKRGKKYHKAHFTPSLASFQGAYIPMQVIQMDNTPFDVFPVDSEFREDLPTPYMTSAMDCYTRKITGFSVSFFPSSSRTVLEVLIQSILPKNNYVDTYETQQEWLIQGFPVLILVDNGMDYRSNALKGFCMKYDIIIEYAPIRTPRYKAFIEQWFNILHKALDDEDVSGTRPLLKYRLENPELKPEADAVLTLQEIEEWLHKWILDEYHFTNPYDDHVPAPYLRWKDFKDGKTSLILPCPREPPNNTIEVDMLHLHTLDQIERTLQYGGVVWEHLKYNNSELAKVFNVTGKKRVKVLIDRRDVRNTWVVNPITEKPIKVGLASGWAQAIAKIHENKPINASAWKRDVKLLKERMKCRISPHCYQKELSRLQRQELMKKAKKETKLIRREREKMRETKRKSINDKIQTKSLNSVVKKSDQNDIQKEKIYEKKWKKEKIDWSKVKELPTDSFFKG